MIEPDVRRERRNFGVRVSMLFAAIFVVAGTNLPYLPVWLDWKDLGPREIAIIMATPLFIRVLVTPAIAFAADRAGDHRRFLIVLIWQLVAVSAGSLFFPPPSVIARQAASEWFTGPAGQLFPTDPVFQDILPSLAEFSAAG